MNNHVVEYQVNRRLGWEPQAGQGNPDTAPGSTAPVRWGHRWTYELTPDGPDATIVTEHDHDAGTTGRPLPPDTWRRSRIGVRRWPLRQRTCGLNSIVEGIR